jgi:hypothetical protein
VTPAGIPWHRAAGACGAAWIEQAGLPALSHRRNPDRPDAADVPDARAPWVRAKSPPPDSADLKLAHLPWARSVSQPEEANVAPAEVPRLRTYRPPATRPAATRPDRS